MYVARKTIKGSIMSNFCAENLIEGEDGREDFLDEDILDVELGTWKMYFDEAVNQYGNGIGILLITLEGSHIPLAIMSNFCAKNPIEGEDGREDFLDEDILDVELGTWKMYFDEVVNQYGNGIGILLITPEGSHIPLAIKLNFGATNNMAEYEACIAGMEALRDLRVNEAKVFGDSTLVIA